MKKVSKPRKNEEKNYFLHLCQETQCKEGHTYNITRKRIIHENVQTIGKRYEKDISKHNNNKKKILIFYTKLFTQIERGQRKNHPLTQKYSNETIESGKNKGRKRKRVGKNQAMY